MFIDDQTYTVKGKTYRRALIRNSYRRNGKVYHDTIANISKCSDKEIKTMKFALENKDKIKQLLASNDDKKQVIKTRKGLSVGALWTLHQMAKKSGIVKALGCSREAKLVLWLIYATCIEQGSRLSATRLARGHAVCDILNLDAFNEDHLYDAMDWLDERQSKIEKKLFSSHYITSSPELFLYDVTSSYFEGMQNELADWGYNRDKKSGKKQIVIGLLTDEEGWPVAIEVFRGNTNDTKTFANQIAKVSERFGDNTGITFVGDRGMIKGPQIEELSETNNDFHYITAISKSQIETLLKKNVFQMELFDNTVCEIFDKQVRYILRRNPYRAEEISSTRQSKLSSLKRFVQKQNTYLGEHPKALPKTALGRINVKIEKLKIKRWIRAHSDKRTLSVEIDEEELEAEAKLDGCYVIKTDLTSKQIDAQSAHDRYKDLAKVEWAFRTAKTTFLELRSIYVRKANRTRAHVFIIMMAYMLAYELRRRWNKLDITIEEGLIDLSRLCATEVVINGVSTHTLPEPDEFGASLFDASGITLPDAIPCRNVKVDTRKKLQSERSNA